MLTDHGILVFVSLLLSLFLLHRFLQIKQVWQAFGNLPAYTILISPTTALATALDRAATRIPKISGGDGFGWRIAYERQAPHEVYFRTQLMVRI